MLSTSLVGEFRKYTDYLSFVKVSNNGSSDFDGAVGLELPYWLYSERKVFKVTLGAKEIPFWDEGWKVWFRATVPANTHKIYYLWHSPEPSYELLNPFVELLDFRHCGIIDYGPIPDTSYVPQGAEIVNGYLFLAAYKSGSPSRVWKIRLTDMKAVGYFDCLSEMTHTSGLAYEPDEDRLYAVDYDSDKCYKIDYKKALEDNSATNHVDGSFTTGLSGTSACSFVVYNGVRRLAITDYQNTQKTYLVNYQAALSAGTMTGHTVGEYTNAGANQGITWDGNHVYESDSGTDKIYKINLAQAVSGGSYSDGLQKEWKVNPPIGGIEDLAYDLQRSGIWTSSESGNKNVYFCDNRRGIISFSSFYSDAADSYISNSKTLNVYPINGYDIAAQVGHPPDGFYITTLNQNLHGYVDVCFFDDMSDSKRWYAAVASLTDNSDRVTLAINTDRSDNYYCIWTGSWSTSSVRRRYGWNIWRWKLDGSNCKLYVSRDGGVSWIDIETITNRAKSIRTLTLEVHVGNAPCAWRRVFPLQDNINVEIQDIRKVKRKW